MMSGYPLDMTTVKHRDMPGMGTNTSIIDHTHEEKVAQTLCGTQKATANDQWFLEHVEEGLKEAGDPATVWLTNEEVNAS